jgi:hypothetical protein
MGRYRHPLVDMLGSAFAAASEGQQLALWTFIVVFPVARSAAAKDFCGKRDFARC